MTLQKIIQALYDSEINFSISCFLDGGFDVKLGGGLYGKNWLQESHCENARDIQICLITMALMNYPDSKFARELKEAII